MDILFTKAGPERKFVELLSKKDNAEKIDAFIKSRDQGFYSIEYTITSVGGKHSKQQSFNPDFFIKITKAETICFVVVEIKSDNDDSAENKAKLKWTRIYFKDLNAELTEKGINQKYIFHFLSPSSYTEFFTYLRDGRLINGKFSSELENKLEEEES